MSNRISEISKEKARGPSPTELGLSIAIALGSVVAATLMSSSLKVSYSVFAALLIFGIPMAFVISFALALTKWHGAYLGAIVGYCLTILTETYWEIFINSAPNSLPGFVAAVVIPIVSFLSLGVLYLILKFLQPHSQSWSVTLSAVALGWPALVVLGHIL